MEPSIYKFFYFFGGFLLTACDLYLGARALGSGKTIQVALKWHSAGLLLMLLMLVGLFGLSFKMNSLIESSPSLKHLERLPADWGADQPTEKREKGSIAIASMVFVNTGKLGVYFDHSTGWKRYIPTEDVIKNHDQNVITQFFMKVTATSAKLLAIACFILWVIVAWLGWHVGRLEHRLTHHSSGTPNGAP